MIAIENEIKLGQGIYAVPDLAFILRLPQQKVRRWLNDFWNIRLGEKYKAYYSQGSGREKTTNFYTLIEFYVFYQLRENKVSTKTIFNAHEEMAHHLKTPYPFASARVLTDGRSILYSLEDGTTISANRSKQIALKESIEKFCMKIEFDKSKMAERYYPLGKQHHIVVDPHHQFGQPVIAGTNILVDTIYSLYKAKEPVPRIARLYELNEKQVCDAIAFCQNAA